MGRHGDENDPRNKPDIPPRMQDTGKGKRKNGIHTVDKRKPKKK